jgi:hypothetical protein
MLYPITLESILNDTQPNDIVEYDFDGSIFDIAAECMDISFEDNAQCMSGIELDVACIALEANGAKLSIKEFFKKVLDVIKNILIFIVKIITWPFRFIIRKIFGIKKDPGKMAMVLIDDKIPTNVQQVNEICKGVEKFVKEADDINMSAQKKVAEVLTSVEKINSIELTAEDKDIIARANGQLDALHNETVQMTETLHKVINKLSVSFLKPDDIQSLEALKILNKCVTHVEGLKKLDTPSREKGVKQLQIDLDAFGKKVQHFPDNARDIMVRTCSDIFKNIRAEIGALGAMNQTIAKIIVQISKSISKTLDVSKMLHKDLYIRDIGSSVMEYAGLDVYVCDKALIAIDDRGSSLSGVAAMRIRSNNGGFGAFNIDGNNQQMRVSGNTYQCIVISTGLYAIKDTHPDWFETVLGHELGHVFTEQYKRISTMSKDPTLSRITMPMNLIPKGLVHLYLVFCNYHIYESSVLCFSIFRIISPLVFDH